MEKTCLFEGELFSEKQPPERGRRRKELWTAFGISCALAFLCVTIISRCSFLYPFNDWVDTNWYMSMGHGIVEGMVPYKDLFEQKGIIIYFIFALNYLVFGNQFWGIYILEFICGAAYLFVCYNILRLFMPHAKSLLYLAAVAALTYTAAGQQQSGGCVEEYCLPMLAYGMYVFLKYFKSGGARIPLYEVALCGLFSGLIFWMKYTVLAFYFAFAVCLFADRCRKGDVKSGFIYAAVFLAAFAVPCVPCLVYLGVNGALADMAEIYLYRNIFSYGGTGWADFWERVRDTVISVARHIYLYFVAVWSMIYVFRKSGRSVYGIYYIVISCTMIAVQVISGKHLQYHFPVVVFLSVGLKPTVELIGWLLGNAVAHIKARRAKKRGDIPQTEPVAEVKDSGFASAAAKKLKVGINAHTAALCAVAVALFVLVFGNCTLAIRQFVPVEYPQLEVAEVIKERGGDDAVLLNYKMGDMGFYTALDQAPQFKYFARNDFSRESFPEMFEETERYVREGIPDYVITDLNAYEEDGELFAQSGYEVIGEYECIRIKENFTWHHMHYILLEKV